MFRSNRFWVIACAVSMACLSLSGAASAQTNWTGTAGSDWSNAINWDNGVPDATVAATINSGTAILDADGAALSLDITGGDGVASQLTIASDHTLTIEGLMKAGLNNGTTSIVSQSAGTLTVAELWLGGDQFETLPPFDGAGVYNMSGGTLNIIGRQIVVGEQGVGTFTQTGGVVNNPDAFYIGDNWVGHSQLTPEYPGAGGTMTISGGIFNGGAYYGIIGTWGGNGTLNVDGTGVLNVNALEMGLGHFDNTAGSTSAINIGGNSQVNLTEHILLAANAATTGTLTQTGGELTAHTLRKGPGAGTYNFTGGTLNVSEVPDMDVANNGGRLNVGGTGAVATLVFGYPGGDPINLALGKTATQSSDPWGFVPGNGVDGNYTNFCHTDNEENAWWRVDLTESDANISVDGITITARADGYNEHFSNFFVRVRDKDDAVLWEQKYVETIDDFLGAGERLEIDLGAFYDARYVEIQIDGWNLFELAGGGYQSGYLFFTEMEVHDSANPSTPAEYTNYSQNASSVLGIELDAANALNDKLVAGTLTLDGTLDVSALGGGFAGGQIFDLLDWETLVGTFDTVNLPTLSGGLEWDTSNLYVTGEVAVVGGPQVPGDANGDGKVDADDAKKLADNWGASEATWAMGDFDGDQIVGPKDASILAANWGHNVPGEANAVPEPNSMSLLIMGLAGLLALARRRRG